MKIALIVRKCHRQGGISRVVLEVAEVLAKLGYEIHIYTTQFSDVKDKRIFYHKVPSWDAKFLDKLGLFKLRIFIQSLIFSILSRFIVNYKNFDIVSVNGDSFAKFDIRCAHSCHKAWLEMTRKDIKGIIDFVKKYLNPHHFRILLIDKFNYKKGNYKKIIAVSEGVKREIIRYYNVLENDIVVIPNGVDLDEFSPKNKELYFKEIRKLYNIEDDFLVLLFIGYDFKRKGLEYIIKALSKLKYEKIKLIVVGRDNKQPYKKLAYSLGIADKVIFVGHQSRVNKFYAASDIFVFPTLYEAFGNVVLESLASGVPVLATKVNGIEELITNGKEGFFILRDPDDISKKINIFLNEKDLIYKMGKNARLRAIEFSWDKIANKYLKVYKEVYKIKYNLYDKK